MVPLFAAPTSFVHRATMSNTIVGVVIGLGTDTQ